MRVLEGMRVIDLGTGVSGGVCPKLLADFGADVIKVERPGSGDPTRLLPPFLGGPPDAEQSAAFLHLNTNKRSLTLDIESPTGREILARLVATCAIRGR